jgi:septal ring factor EnvC (AmiA/AmiB activator)
LAARGTLRTRYVTLLGELEDQLAGLGAEEQRLRDQIGELERQAAEALAALTPKTPEQGAAPAG